MAVSRRDLLTKSVQAGVSMLILGAMGDTPTLASEPTQQLTTTPTGSSTTAEQEIRIIREGFGPRQKRPLGRATVLSNFDEPNWKRSYSTGTVKTQQGSYVRHGGSSLTVASDVGTSVTAELSFATAKNLSSHNFVADFYIEDVSALTTSNPLTIEFFTDHLNPAKRWTWRPAFARLKTGWNRLAFARGAGMGASGSPNTADWSDTYKIRVSHQAAAGRTAVIHYDSLHAMLNPRSKGMIVISTDDGFASDFTVVRPKLDQYGMRGTFNIAGSLIGTPDYLSMAQMQLLDDAGHCLCDHTYEHQPVTKFGTVDQMMSHLKLNQDFLSNYTSGRGMAHLVYPGGYNSDVTRQAATKSYASARITEQPGQVYTTEPFSDLLALCGYGATAARTLADYKAQFNAVEAYKVALIWYCHKVVESGPTGNEILRSTFEACVDDIATRNIEVVTMDEFYNCLTVV